MGKSNADRVKEINALIGRIDGLFAEMAGEQSALLSAKELRNCPVTWVRSLLRSRAKLRSLFEAGLFGDPAFELLLDLFASEEEGRLVSVSAACATSGVPPTTALRWIALLNARGLIERLADPLDGRRVFLQLTPHVREIIREWVASSSFIGLAGD